jgi:hypothetical protein
MTEASDIRALEAWLTTHTYSIPWIDHQDSEWAIASTFGYSDLIPLLDTPDCISSRRDSLIYALVLQLESLLDPNESHDTYNASDAAIAKQELLQFARKNWENIKRIDREIGFGHDFNSFVVPILSAKSDEG